MLERYLLFSYANCYALGGMLDAKGTFNTIDEAVEYHNTTELLYFQVLDLTNLNIVLTDDSDVVDTEGLSYTMCNDLKVRLTNNTEVV